jgi:hypothetical protein
MQVFRRLRSLVDQSAAQLDAVQTQVGLKSREARKAKIVHSQLLGIQREDPQVRCWEPLGKACVRSYGSRGVS